MKFLLDRIVFTVMHLIDGMKIMTAIQILMCWDNNSYCMYDCFKNLKFMFDNKIISYELCDNCLRNIGYYDFW